MNKGLHGLLRLYAARVAIRTKAIPVTRRRDAFWILVWATRPVFLQ